MANDSAPPGDLEPVPLPTGEEPFRRVLEASPDGFIILQNLRDATGTIVDFVIAYTNPVAAKGVNLTQQELLGQQLLQLFPDCKTNGIFDRYVAVAESGISTTFETFYQSPHLTGWFRNVVVQLSDKIAVSFSDITDRKQTELALQQQEQHFRVALQAAKLGSWEHDLTTGVLTCSAQCKANFGLPPEAEFTHETLFAALHPDDRPIVQAAIQQAIATRTDYEVEERCYHPDGSLHWLTVRGQLVYNSQGEPMRLVGVTLDITDRKHAEDTLRQREAELRLITNTVPVLISFVDREQRYRFVNQSYERLFGRSAAELHGEYLWNVMGNAAYETIRPYVEQVLAGQEVTFESKIPFEAVGVRDFSVTYVPRWNSQGQVDGFVALVTDISRRKQAEENLRQSAERLRVAQQAANAGVWDWEITTNQVTWSEEYYQLYGLDPATTEPSYENWLKSIIPADRDRVDQSSHRALVHQTDLNVEFRILHPIHGERWLTAIGQTFYDHQQQPRRMTGIALDITDRKQSEAALRRSEERFQLIAKATNDVIWDSDLLSGAMWWSERLQTVFGYAPATMEPNMSSWTKRVHPDDLARVHTTYAACLSSDAAVWTDEYRFRRADGDYADVLDRAYIIRDAAGQAVRVVGAMADITERKQVQRELQQTLQTLRESEEWARLAIQVGRLGGWRLHLATSLVEMDERMREIWGEPEEVVMVPLPEVIARIHPDDRERVAQAVTAAIAPQSSGMYEIEYRIIWNDGSERWVLAKGQAQFAEEGEVRRTVDFFGTLIDITDRKQTEAALRNSAEQLSFALMAAKLGDWSWNAKTDLVTLSDQAAAMFSIPPGPHMTWTQMQTLIHPNDREQARYQVEHAIAHHSNYDIEYRVVRPNGTSRWIAAKGRAQYEASGEVLGMLGVVQDITPRKQAEAEREQLLVRERAARQEAEQANRIKDEFLAVLSHELRSPLNPILGWSKLLRTRQFDAEATARALETIERNAKLQAQLIEDLLDVSRILRGKMVLNVEPVHLDTVIDAALETVRLSAEAKGIAIHKRVADEVGLIAGDVGRLQQIMWNLLSNAVKFTPEAGQIEIRLEQVGNYAQIQIQDTGKGIAPEFLPQVFEYFRQEDGTTTRKFGGLGLGLAIVRYLTEQHGGTVKAASPGVGLGATFTVLFPLLKSSSASNAASIGADHAKSSPLPLAHRRILIVDDETDMRELINTILQATGADIKVAASAVAALTILPEFQPDLLISDIGMPEIDGYTFLRQVRQLPPEQGGQIPAIALTAYAGEIDRQQAIAAGFQMHLSKPIEPEELVNAIAGLVRGES